MSFFFQFTRSNPLIKSKKFLADLCYFYHKKRLQGPLTLMKFFYYNNLMLIKDELAVLTNETNQKIFTIGGPLYRTSSCTLKKLLIPTIRSLPCQLILHAVLIEILRAFRVRPTSIAPSMNFLSSYGQ